MASSIIHLLDSAVDQRLDGELIGLLSACFTDPVFRQRRWCHEPPRHRWLIRDDAGLAAHLAAHDKVAGWTGGEIRFAGIAEVCVRPDLRGRGLVRALLTQAHADLAGLGLGWAALLGRPQVYASSGYRATGQPLRHHAAAGAVVAVLDSFQVARLRPDAPPWPAGELDLRGPLF